DLDAAVFAAYGWFADTSDSEILERLVALNLQTAGVTEPSVGKGDQRDPRIERVTGVDEEGPR
ncbi:MAG: hypothetical protein P4L93_03245, partial [Coriobacteriia bacterium]|nr:hypothetical protein [Coriobacteriia bacterium]